MDAAVEEENRPLHHGQAVSRVDEARLDVLGGRVDKKCLTFQENIKARLWYADVYFISRYLASFEGQRNSEHLFPSSSGVGLKTLLLGWFPIVSWLPCYSIRANALGDLLSGLTIGVIQLPLGEDAVQRSSPPSSVPPLMLDSPEMLNPAVDCL